MTRRYPAAADTSEGDGFALAHERLAAADARRSAELWAQIKREPNRHGVRACDRPCPEGHPQELRQKGKDWIEHCPACHRAKNREKMRAYRERKKGKKP